MYTPLLSTPPLVLGLNLSESTATANYTFFSQDNGTKTSQYKLLLRYRLAYYCASFAMATQKPMQSFCHMSVACRHMEKDVLVLVEAGLEVSAKRKHFHESPEFSPPSL